MCKVVLNEDVGYLSRGAVLHDVEAGGMVEATTKFFDFLKDGGLHPSDPAIENMEIERINHHAMLGDADKDRRH